VHLRHVCDREWLFTKRASCHDGVRDDLAYEVIAAVYQLQRASYVCTAVCEDRCGVQPRSRRDFSLRLGHRAVVLFRAILWECSNQHSLPSLHHCIYCPLLSAMACLIAVPALIMPAALRRSQHVFRSDRVHTAVRVPSFSTQHARLGSDHTVALQDSRQRNVAMPHQITRLGAMATNVEHALSDLEKIDELVDSKASTTDLKEWWQRLADGAVALTVIMALVRRHALSTYCGNATPSTHPNSRFYLVLRFFPWSAHNAGLARSWSNLPYE
jgi:hypothetical protein